MTLAEAIAAWATGRPGWQRAVLARLAREEVLGPEDYRAIAERLAAGMPEPGPFLQTADLPGSRPQGPCVTLESVRVAGHVNALAAGQQLTLGASGMTVIYGDNASGKSGYARLLKHSARARHQEAVRTNVFGDSRSDVPDATIAVDYDGSSHMLQWPVSEPLLKQMTYYDEACGDAYVSRDAEVTYRPFGLLILDRLVRACDGVRGALDTMLGENSLRRVQLPIVPDGTDIAQFLGRLSHRTSVAELDAACSLPPNAEEELQRLADEEARLRASDPKRERTRLLDIASQYGAVAAHLGKLDQQVGADAEDHLQQLRVRAVELRAAANVVSSTSFDSEPVPGVGSGTWRSLWEAARRYSEGEAYPGQPFPVTGVTARCVLCQQALSEEARDRLSRFHAYMHQETEREAVRAEAALQLRVTELQRLETNPAAVAVALERLEAHDAGLIGECRAALSVHEARRSALLAFAGERPPQTAPSLPAILVDRLQDNAQHAREQALALDESSFQQLLATVIKSRAELRGRQAVQAARGVVLAEVARLKERASLEQAKRVTETGAITRKSSEFARAYITALIRDRFTREVDRLRLDRVTLADIVGHKGQVFHKPALLETTQPAEVTEVLSQGEQTALGLAGYFTEAHFEESRSAMILDDPVTSLSHVRRAYVARRLAEFARDRQVIVFTHEIAFVGELRRAAEHEDITFTERSVERRGGTQPGICLDGHPWKAKDASGRLDQLRQGLAHIKRERTTWTQETYEAETADWAGRLSETWERIINLEIANKVVDIATSEVRPKMFRMLARITEDDNQQFQESYARCSRWARRHDKSPDLNYVPPEIDELNAELALVKEWLERVRQYAK